MPKLSKSNKSARKTVKPKAKPVTVEEAIGDMADNITEVEEHTIVSTEEPYAKPSTEEVSYTPFSDGLVHPKLAGIVTIVRVSDAEVDLLQNFLKYFSETSPFVGNIISKTSFMKKKGGRLL